MYELDTNIDLLDSKIEKKQETVKKLKVADNVLSGTSLTATIACIILSMAFPPALPAAVGTLGGLSITAGCGAGGCKVVKYLFKKRNSNRIDLRDKLSIQRDDIQETVLKHAHNNFHEIKTPAVEKTVSRTGELNNQCNKVLKKKGLRGKVLTGYNNPYSSKFTTNNYVIIIIITSTYSS